MFLSNRKSIIVIIVACVIYSAGCGGMRPPTAANTAVTGTASERFPFPTTEPTEFRGELVVGDGLTESRYFVARKGEKWRFDVVRDASPLTTQLRSDRVYTIDHAAKTYVVEAPANEADFGSVHFNSLTWGFFRGANYLDYEEVERGGGTVKYRARMYKGSKSDVLVTIDEASGMMVRQEVTDVATERDTPGARFIYEMRKLELAVDDAVFEVPAGYRRTEPTARFPDER